MSSTTRNFGNSRRLEAPQVSSMMARAGLRVRLFMMVAVAAVPALGVMAISQYSLHQQMVVGDVAGTNWYQVFAFTGELLLIGGALLSLGFGIAVGEQFLRQPTEALLHAGKEWSEGRFDVRIDVGASANTEFGRIATTFNTMAEAIGSQHDALRDINNDLETRVTARTHELSESHRLLINEMAERERFETALRQAQKLQAVGQLAGGIAHDFNNLLTTIVGALDLLRGRLAGHHETMLRLVDNALQAAERASKLTNQLLTFSRRRTLAPVPTDMNETIVALTDLLSNTLGRGVRIETDLAAGLWPAMVDPSQIEAALLNLAINARDAMPEGGTLTIATCNVTADARGSITEGEYVAVQVTDTGIGMSEDVANLAFEPFFTTKEPGRGAGLGLSQVHGLATQSGGDARLRSVPGIGTTVSLLLPRAAAQALPPAELIEPSQPRNRPRARILVVDDDAGVLAMAGDMLIERGFTAVLAENAERALEILQADPRFDLMLTDFGMPGMNGLRLIQTVSELFPNMRSVLMTAHAELAAGEPIGQERIIQKPFNMATLDDRITRALGRPRLQVIQGGAAAVG